jgi:hypothetical protein
MSEVPFLLILVLFVNGVPAASSGGAASETPLLRDGFILAGVDGTLIGPDSNDVYLFELSSDVNDYRSVVKAETRLELLPSSALEEMVADAKIRSAATYRLWNGRVTKYKGRNFIFPNYFLPLSKPKQPRSETSQQGQNKPADTTSEPGREIAVDEPNDVLAIPPEILEKLRARREKGAGGGQQTVDANRAGTVAQQPAADNASVPNVRRYTPSADFIFADRTAFLVEQGDGRLTFVPDALGRNIQRLSVRLLACEALELAEREQSAEPEPVRFKIAGIMTKYKGNHYLLLQRATRAYNYGNFGR